MLDEFSFLPSEKDLRLLTAGLVAKNIVEAPKVVGRKVVGWQTNYAPKRKWGLDMAAFAINLELFLQHPECVIISLLWPFRNWMHCFKSGLSA